MRRRKKKSSPGWNDSNIASPSWNARGLTDPFLGDVAIYAKAGRWIVQHNEFYGDKAGDWTLDVLADGLLRASQAAQGDAPWYIRTGASSARAHRSIVDGSLQPYAVTLPADYGKDQARVWPIEVVLHGRDSGPDRGEIPAASTPATSPHPRDRIGCRLTSSAVLTTPTAGPASRTCWRPSTTS